MVIIISPALKMKTYDFDKSIVSLPKYMEKTKVIVGEVQKYAPYELESLMKVGPEIALNAYQYFQNFGSKRELTPAINAFNGLVYQHLSGDGFNEAEIKFATNHLRILSGLYGSLSPYDLISPYRLGLNMKIKIKGESLYNFWGSDIFDDVKSCSKTILNLSSKEYSKTIKRYATSDTRVIDVDFLSYKRQKLKTIVAWAKIARGEMARFVIKNEITDINDIKKFCWNDSVFIPELSTDDKFTFIITGEE